DDVSVFGINLDLGKIAAASPEPGLAIDTTPVFAGVVRAVDPALLRRIHQGIEPPRVRGDDADADSSKLLLGTRKSLRELPPGGAAVAGLEQPAAGPLPGAVFPGTLPRRPEDSINGLGGGRIERQGNGTRVFVLVKYLLPRVAAVGRAKDAALGVGAVRVTEHRDKHAASVARIDDERADLLSVAQADMPPGLAAVGGSVDPVANRQVR